VFVQVDEKQNKDFSFTYSKIVSVISLPNGMPLIVPSLNIEPIFNYNK
jgi:hypothetical protein